MAILDWFTGLWYRFKPVIKSTIVSLIWAKLYPEMIKFIEGKKEQIIGELNSYSAEDNARKACQWLADYFNRQL